MTPPLLLIQLLLTQLPLLLTQLLLSNAKHDVKKREKMTAGPQAWRFFYYIVDSCY